MPNMDTLLPGDETRENMAHDLVGDVAVIREGMESDANGAEWLDVRVCARVLEDGHAIYWLTTGDAQYDTDHGDACGASTVDLSEPLTFAEALAIVDEMVEQVMDQIADR